MEIVPVEERKIGFYSRYILVPKKDGGLHPILNLHHLNRALAKHSFKMVTLKQILSLVQPWDWFIFVDPYQVHEHGSLPSSFEWNTSSELPGRLTNYGSLNERAL